MGATVEEFTTADLDMKPASFKIANYWARVLRKFREASKNFYRHARVFMKQIKLLYAYEDEATQLALSRAGPDPTDEVLHPLLIEARRSIRNEKSRATIKDMLEWLKTPRALPQSALGKAIRYALNQWPGLTLFLDEPEVLLDNNRSERALRGPVVGRKNFTGCRSERGALVAAVFYSLIETAKLCGVDPASYLHDVVQAGLRQPGAILLPKPLQG